MNLGEILIWESSSLLLLVPVVIGLVMMVRWLQGLELETNEHLIRDSHAQFFNNPDSFHFVRYVFESSLR
jgi:hypothetical protein